MTQNGENWKTGIRVSARTDVGLRRANNQDSHAVALAASRQQFRKRGHLFVVADGMGAHAAGELASKIAVDTISLCYSKRNSEPVADALQNSVYDAHKQIRTQSEQDEAFHDMGRPLMRWLFRRKRRSLLMWETAAFIGFATKFTSS